MVLAKKPPLLITIGTALLLIGGGMVAYWALQWRAARVRSLPAGMRAVPEEAVAVVSLSTNPEQWRRLRQFGTPETQVSFDQQLANWRDRWLTAYDVSFNQDVEPWIGPEVTIAWLSSSETASEGDLGTVVPNNLQRVLLLPIADPEAAQTAAASLPLIQESDNQQSDNQQSGSQQSDNQQSGNTVEYRGVTLSVFPAASEEDSKTLLVGVLGAQLILVAEDETVAQQAIDAFKGGRSLVDVSGYRRSFEYIGLSNSFGRLYLNVPAATQLLAQSSQPPLPTALLESFQDSRGIAATIGISSQGVQIKSTSWLGQGSDRIYGDTNVAAQLPQYLPSDTFLMASGGNFQQFWQDLSERRTWGALTTFDPQNLALALQSSTGLTLENDLLPWMSGEFAVALVPSPETPPEEGETALPSPGLVALSQVSDRPKAEQTFAQLDTVVKNRYRFSVLNEPRREMELVKWISPFRSVALSRGWLNSSVAFFTVGISTEDAIVPKPKRPLATAPLFKRTTEDAPYPNNGYFYLNLEALSRTNDNLFLPTLPVENQGALRALRALGVTATILDEQRVRYDLYVVLKQGNCPGPLPSTSSSDEDGG